MQKSEVRKPQEMLVSIGTDCRRFCIPYRKEFCHKGTSPVVGVQTVKGDCEVDRRLSDDPAMDASRIGIHRQWPVGSEMVIALDQKAETSA